MKRYESIFITNMAKRYRIYLGSCFRTIFNNLIKFCANEFNNNVKTLKPEVNDGL